jgi:hypothetical protein
MRSILIPMLELRCDEEFDFWVTVEMRRERPGAGRRGRPWVTGSKANDARFELLLHNGGGVVISEMPSRKLSMLIFDCADLATVNR